MSGIPALSRIEYRFVPEDGFVPVLSDAYRIYAGLLEQLPPEEAEWLHSGGEKPLAQHLAIDRKTNSITWTVGLLSREIREVMYPLLADRFDISLNPGKFTAEKIKEESFESALEFIRYARENPVDKFCSLNIESPLSFKQAGSYVIFPQERLMIQSLLNKWNAAFPEYYLGDQDAEAALINGVYICDYNLRSVRFSMKGAKIPACTGKLYMGSKLPAPMFEIWNLLVHYSRFSGIGIKTTLGMGGVNLSP